MSETVGAHGRSGPALSIGGRRYPVLLPRLGDPRLHLAAVIVSLQVLGQTSFGFRLSIAQILVALATCAVLEVGIAFWRRRVILWPASALLTGNGVAFILRVPGTEHGDWWSLRGWWIFAGTAAIGLLSKYVVRIRGRHVFNPSNIGLVICFLVLGETRAEPLDFWWGHMSPWLALALGIIVAGGLAILTRLRMLGVAIGFWIAFAAGLAVLAASGHSMTASWHLGPITGWAFWWTLVSSPEILVFLFFMITDPKTSPQGRVARTAYGVGVALTAVLLIAPFTTEYDAKVAVLGALALVCAARTLLELAFPRPGSSGDRAGEWLRALAGGGPSLRPARIASALAIGATGVAAFGVLVVLAGTPARGEQPRVAADAGPGADGLPDVTVVANEDVASTIDEATARRIARDVVAGLREQAQALRVGDGEALERSASGSWLGELRARLGGGEGLPADVPADVGRVWVTLERRAGQAGPAILVTVEGTAERATYTREAATIAHVSGSSVVRRTFEVAPHDDRFLIVASLGDALPAPEDARPLLAGAVAVRLQVAGSGPFPQGAPLGVSIALSSVAGATAAGELALTIADAGGRAVPFFREHVVVPTSGGWERQLAVVPSQWFAATGEYRLAAEIDGQPAGQPVSVEVTTAPVTIPRFEDVTAASGVETHVPAGACGQFAVGAAWADVDGDGHLDLFVPRLGEPARLFVNDGTGRFTEEANLRGVAIRGGNGAAFADYDNDGDADLYVATDGSDVLLRNDGSGRFEDVSAAAGIGDDDRGMSASWADADGDGFLDLYVTNYMRCLGDWETASEVVSQVEYHPDLLYRNDGDGTFTDVTALLEGTPGTADGATTGAGFAASWFDYDGDGRVDLYLGNDFVGPSPDQNRLWRNDGTAPGEWSFADVSTQSGTGLFMNTMGIAVGDIDRDLDLDLALTNIGPNRLLRNEGDGTFVEAAASAGVDRPLQAGGAASITWGAGFYDLDLDGWEDLYVAAGNIGLRPDGPEQLDGVFVNDGTGRRFLDLSAPSGASVAGDSKGVAFADYDRDGDVDLLVVDQGGSPRLYRNITPRDGRTWLEVDPVGTRSPRDSCGAVVELTLPDGGRMLRQLFCGSTSVASGNESIVHFGLGKVDRVAKLVVRWPSGRQRVERDLAPGQVVTLVEPGEAR